MKIYYIDDQIDINTAVSFNLSGARIVDGKNGYSNCMETYDIIRSNGGDVITNCHWLMNALDLWNEKTNQPNIFIYIGGKFIPIQDLTDKEIRQAHNIAKMYANGAFDLED